MSGDRTPGRPAYRGLVACDLDGTLLRADGSAADDIVPALLALESARIPLVVCTGRPLTDARRLVDRAGLRPVATACFHGGLVVDERSGRVVLHHSLGAEQAGRAAAVLEGHGLAITWYLGDEARPWREAPQAAAATRLLATGGSADIEKAHDQLVGLAGLGLLVNRPRPDRLDVRSSRATKERALRFIADDQQVSLARTIACGDDASDEGMLRIAGLGIRVASPGGPPTDPGERRVPQSRLGARLLGLAESWPQSDQGSGGTSP